MKKILIVLITFFISLFTYLFFNPKLVVEKIEIEKKVPIKILPHKDYSNNGNDSLFIYLPYKIKILNYSTQVLKRPNFYFKAINYDHHPQFMVYNSNGINVFDLSNKYMTIEDLQTIGKVYPLIPKTFIVYRYNVISTNKLKLSLDSITFRKLEREFINSRDTLNAKTSFEVPKKIIDSLYKIEDKKIMHFSFRSMPLWKLKLIPKTNKSKFINLSNLSKDELYKEFTRPIE